MRVARKSAPHAVHRPSQFTTPARYTPLHNRNKCLSYLNTDKKLTNFTNGLTFWGPTVTLRAIWLCHKTYFYGVNSNTALSPVNDCVLCEIQTQFLYTKKIIISLHWINLFNPTCHVMHQPSNIQQFYVLPTLYLCVLYLSKNKQRIVPLTA